jgi:hypothetical protein
MVSGKAVSLSGIGLVRDEGGFAAGTKNPARFPGRAHDWSLYFLIARTEI